MSKFNAQRKRNMYDPESSKPFKLSRSKISDYLNCKRCFYLDRRLGVGQPPGYPFTLNLAVDALLKNEFDICREAGRTHILLAANGLGKLTPAYHDGDIVDWRNNFKGVQFLHEPTNFLVHGAIDDLWYQRNEDETIKEYYVVDYKATSRKEPVTEIKDEFGYQQQMEVYQWLLRGNGLNVSNIGYFLYANAKKDLPTFDEKLEFDMTLIPCEGNDSWIEPTLIKIHGCLNSDKIPLANDDCDLCNYREAVKKHVNPPKATT